MEHSTLHARSHPNYKDKEKMSEEIGQLQCPECQSQDIVSTEDFVTVCTACGSVVNDIPESVCQTRSSFRNPDRSNNKNFRTLIKKPNPACPTPTIPVSFGVDLIHTVTKNLNIVKNIRDKAINLLHEVISNEEFKYCFTNAKQSLALCCLYLICNQENNPITLTELAANTDCIFHHLGSILLRLQKIYPEKCQHNTRFLELHVPFYLFKFNFEDKEKQTIAHYATNLIWMWREALLVQGYHPIPVIQISLFYSWKAVQQNRAFISMKEFCDKFQIDYKKRLQSHTKRFFLILKDFVKCCPLMEDADVSPRNISLKIPQIVEMKRIILLNYQKQQDEKLAKSRKRNLETEPLAEKNVPLNAEDDVEVSDTEIDQYLRTEKEMKEMEKLADSL